MVLRDISLQVGAGEFVSSWAVRLREKHAIAIGGLDNPPAAASPGREHISLSGRRANEPPYQAAENHFVFLILLI